MYVDTIVPFICNTNTCPSIDNTIHMYVCSQVYYTMQYIWSPRDSLHNKVIGIHSEVQGTNSIASHTDRLTD